MVVLTRRRDMSSRDRADCTLRCPEKEVQKSHKTFYRALHAGVHILYWSPVSTIANRCYELREPALSARQSCCRAIYIKFPNCRVVSISGKSFSIKSKKICKLLHLKDQLCTGCPRARWFFNLALRERNIQVEGSFEILQQENTLEENI